MIQMRCRCLDGDRSRTETESVGEWVVGHMTVSLLLIHVDIRESTLFRRRHKVDGVQLWREQLGISHNGVDMVSIFYLMQTHLTRIQTIVTTEHGQLWIWVSLMELIRFPTS